MRLPIRGWAAAAAVAMSAAVPAAARADFTADTVISGSTTVEADYGFEPAISADGRYVAFSGSQAGVTGVYRKDLRTGALDFVAGGDAAAPSISSDGRYVSFTTTAAHPASGTGARCSSVFVRDMSLASTAKGAYRLASALDGRTAGLTYGGSASGGCPGGGSSAAPGVSLSADGRKVVFTVVGSSNLTIGAGGAVTTPGAQVVERDLDTERTTLVSQTMASLAAEPAAVPGGAAMTDNSTGTGAKAATANADPGDSTAAISADGTTVVWLGIDIPAQAPANASADSPRGHDNEYDEPLWRRIAAGPSSPTRRVTGGDDPSGPCPNGCAGPLDLQWDGPSNPNIGQDAGPERGSLIQYAGFAPGTAVTGSSLANATPQLSADGRMVAITSTQPATGQDPVYTNSFPSNVATNAFVVDMTPGLSRSTALTRVTAWASTNFDDPSLAGSIEHLTISPEGDRVAFVTRRTVFPYSPPALISPQLSEVEFEQLYVANLADGTLELASTGFDGQPANGFVLSPSFSAHGGPIAFASSATNLVYGAFADQAGGSEAFITTEVKPPAIAGVQSLGPQPPNPTIAPAWVISATVRQGRHGVAVLDVSVPGAGRLRASARATLAHASSKGRRRHARHRRGVSTATIARTSAGTHAAGVVQLRLHPAARYRSLISRLRHGLYATITVRFSAAGHRTLTETVPFDLSARHAKSPER